MSGRPLGAHLLMVALGAAAWLSATAHAQQPSFRSAVDLIAVEVQVVDNDGRPIAALNPSSFQVTINGHTRRVLSADYIQTTTPDGAPVVARTGVGPSASNVWPTTGASSVAGRIYILAFDLASLTLADSRAVVATSRDFISRLQPQDKVGLYTFPIGPRVIPTTDHAMVSAKVNTITGNKRSFGHDFNLSPSEIIDINAEAARQMTQLRRPAAGAPALVGDESTTIRKVQLRECGNGELRCVEDIIAEAQNAAFLMEGDAIEGLNGLRELVRLLTTYEGRKTVVMFSSGIASSDRPGGRPDMGNLPKTLGQDAAATNTTIYTLHIDTGDLHAMSAETQRADKTGTRSRDGAVQRRVLDEFSWASGGALMRVATGSGEYALTRVLRETSSHYLLGVEPDAADRDGRLRQLRVKVSQPGVTVRSRQWVVVPIRRMLAP
ncbi:MAG: VWA domain-containing protein [Vicinamibacterales bacterium]